MSEKEQEAYELQQTPSSTSSSGDAPDLLEKGAFSSPSHSAPIILDPETGKPLSTSDPKEMKSRWGIGGGRRPVKYYAPVYNGLAAGLALVFVGNGIRTLLMEWRLDGDATRFALVAVAPLLYCVSLVRPFSFLRTLKGREKLIGIFFW